MDYGIRKADRDSASRFGEHIIIRIAAETDVVAGILPLPRNRKEVRTVHHGDLKRLGRRIGRTFPDEFRTIELSDFSPGILHDDVLHHRTDQGVAIFRVEHDGRPVLVVDHGQVPDLDAVQILRGIAGKDHRVVSGEAVVDNAILEDQLEVGDDMEAEADGGCFMSFDPAADEFDLSGLIRLSHRGMTEPDSAVAVVLDDAIPERDGGRQMRIVGNIDSGQIVVLELAVFEHDVLKPDAVLVVGFQVEPAFRRGTARVVELAVFHIQVLHAGHAESLPVVILADQVGQTDIAAVHAAHIDAVAAAGTERQIIHGDPVALLDADRVPPLAGLVVRLVLIVLLVHHEQDFPDSAQGDVFLFQYLEKGVGGLFEISFFGPDHHAVVEDNLDIRGNEQRPGDPVAADIFHNDLLCAGVHGVLKTLRGVLLVIAPPDRLRLGDLPGQNIVSFLRIIGAGKKQSARGQSRDEHCFLKHEFPFHIFLCFKLNRLSR
ncbi:MAG: hypothetical protein BWY31_01289 [Lentisphaerae bacterium ADurb.Bin242]|nr:MAG: hypothetical protein BWY31_01289 [Lentisphaerae bacterium ADurb.Bin242]